MTDSEKRVLQAKLSLAYNPSAPIDSMELFAGRSEQTEMVINAVFQRGQHVILYGERGVGKTSLAKVIAQIMAQAGIKTINSDTINCDPTDDFSSLWHKALKELTYKIETLTGFTVTKEKQQNLDQLVPPNITPDDVRRALSTLNQRAVVIFDEFDRVKTKETRILMADTIKNLSDHSVQCTLVIVGVAQSVGELIQEHKSIDRALVQVPMPRMPRSELVQIITRGQERSGMPINNTVVEKIIRLSHGLPHYTHLLCLESGLASVERSSENIENEDFSKAITRIVKSKRTVSEQYYAAVLSAHKDSTHKMTLLMCALSPIDEHGFFQASSVSKTLSTLTQKEYPVSAIQRHLTEFTTEKRGAVLQRQGTARRYRYRFANPLVQPYTIIHSLSDHLITESQLWLLDQPTYK